MYYTPDLTGTAPGCFTDNDIYMVHANQQRIEFSIPVYLTSIKVTKLGTINQVLSPEVDWIVRNEDVDHTSMARMMVYDNTFDKVLVKAITIMKPYSAMYQINIEQQRLFPIDIKQSLLNGRRLEVTPDLIGNLLETVEYLTMITRPVTDIHSDEENNPRLYALDPHKENPRNVVTDETHEVNVLENHNIIRPVAGSFFRDTVTVRIKDNPDVLKEGIDYHIIGVDLAKTRISTVTAGVYNFILMVREYVGMLEIGYHAYGGDATLYDIEALSKKVNNVLDYLNDSSFLTASSVGRAPIIISLSTKIQELEEEMRKLYDIRPSYGDVTSGSSALLRISSTDADLHWYSIASLYKFDGSEIVVTADSMRFRLSSLLTKFIFECIVTVNINNPNDPFTISVLSENYPKGFIPFEDYSEVDNIIRPQLRIIYNKNEQQQSGIILQLGIELKGIVEETICIEDLSGKESCWKLIPTTELAIGPQDDVVALPAADHVYDEVNPDSTSIASLVPFKDGYIVYAGALPLNRPTGGFKQFELAHMLPANVDIRRITKCRLELQEFDGVLFPIDIAIIPGAEDTTGLGYFMYNGVAATINIRIWRVGDKTNLTLVSNVDATTTAVELDLRHVFIFTV